MSSTVSHTEKVGDVFEAEVRGIASDGRAIVSHPSGKTFFVAGLWTGEKAKLKITATKSRVGFAKTIELLEPSRYRHTPPCHHHGFDDGQCGGCPWQFIDYAEQVREKHQRVVDVFSRIGVNQAIKPTWASELEYGYRNRAQLKSDGEAIGYVSGNSNILAPISECLILTDTNRQTLIDLRAQLPNRAWQPKRKRQWVTIDIDEDTDVDSISVDQRRPFRQANTAQNLRMRQWLAQKLSAFTRESEVLELFCGSGNFTEILAQKKFKQVFAVESVAAALENIARNNWENIQPINADLFQEEELNRVLRQASAAEILILDPPRDGLKIKGKLFDKKSALREVFYISCDIATLTRDVSDFLAHHFKVKEVQALDQFPHTPHIECLVHLSRR